MAAVVSFVILLGGYLTNYFPWLSLYHISDKNSISSKMKIVFIIPTYNEAENIGVLLEKVLALGLSDSKIIIIDDNSPDGTGEIVESLSKKSKTQILVIQRKGKLGLGSAYKEGFRIALRQNASVILTMDADLSHDPNAIPDMLGELKESDLVIGSRYVEGGGIVGFPLWRLALSSIAQALCRFFLGIKVYDSTSAFRVYKTKVIKSIKPDSIRSEGYSFLIEVVFRTQKAGFKIKEVPIIFKARELGKSKVSQSEIYKAFLTVLRLRLG